MSRGARRLVVVGNGGSGKTRLSSRLAAAWQVPHIELDELAAGPNWSWVLPEILHDRIRSAIDRESWIVEGINRDELRRLVMPHATMVVWLDLPKSVIARRLFFRSLRYVVGRAELNGSRETWRDLWHRDGFVRRTVAKHDRRSRNFATLLEESARPGLEVVRLRSAREVRAWLRDAVVS